MFNFGWGELVLIGIVALIAIGPKELPTVLRTIGQALGKVRRMANEFQGQFQEALREADIADLKKQADDLTSSFNSSVTDISSFDPMADTRKEIEQSLDLEQSATSSDPMAADDAVNPSRSGSSQALPLPDVDVPLPDAPAAVSEKDLAVAETPLPKETSSESPKQAGGKA